MGYLLLKALYIQKYKRTLNVDLTAEQNNESKLILTICGKRRTVIVVAVIQSVSFIKTVFKKVKNLIDFQCGIHIKLEYFLAFHKIFTNGLCTVIL